MKKLFMVLLISGLLHGMDYQEEYNVDIPIEQKVALSLDFESGISRELLAQFKHQIEQRGLQIAENHPLLTCSDKAAADDGTASCSSDGTTASLVHNSDIDYNEGTVRVDIATLSGDGASAAFPQEKPYDQLAYLKHIHDTTYAYRRIDLDSQSSTMKLSDAEMQEIHALYLDRSPESIQQLQAVRDDLDANLNQRAGLMGYLQQSFDHERGVRERRLSFANRVLRHHAEQVLKRDGSYTTKAENAVREFLCTRSSLTNVRHQIENRQQILASGKHSTGKNITELEKRVIQKEIDLMQESLQLPGMKAVEIMQQETTTFKQALWEYSRLGDCSAIVGDVARTALESYPEYEAYLQAQQEHSSEPEVLLNQDAQVVMRDIPLKPVSILDVTDLTAGRPLLEHYAQDSPIRTRFLEIYDEVKGNLPVEPNVEHDTMREVWNRIEREGILDDDAVYFAKCYFHHLAPTNPLEHPQEFATNVAKYATWWAVNLAATEGMSGVVQTMAAFSQLQDLMKSDFSGMTRREKLDFLAEQSAEITMALLTSKALNKLAPGLKQSLKSSSITSRAEEPVISNAAQFTEAENSVAVTTDGITVEVTPDEMPNTSVLKNAADDVTGGAKTIVKVDKMAIFFKKTEFGKNLRTKVQKLRGREYQGQSIYKVTEKNQNPYLKKGDYFYLDALHKDHLEIFDQRGNFKSVLNLDGTQHLAKSKSALLEGRNIKRYL